MRADNVVDLRPDYDSIVSHLKVLFGNAMSGMVEIAWTPSNNKNPAFAELFDVADLELAAEKAVEVNSVPGQNVYVGAALRKPGTPPTGRCEDVDFYEAWTLHADCDDAQQVESAKAAYRAAGLEPPVVCITGRTPYLRAHLWWPLDEPITDPEEYRAALTGLSAALGSDPLVINPSRIMRLGGTVAWAKKEGRVPERTELRTYPTHRQTFDADEMAAAFPPVARRASRQVVDTATVRGGSAIAPGKVQDGRERYMRDTILAVLVEMVGANGLCEWPTAQELFDEAWPQYAANADFSRPGRREDEFAAKCESTLRRAHMGRIHGAATVEECHASDAAKKNAAKNESRNGYTGQPDAMKDEDEEGDKGLVAKPLGLIDPAALERRKWIIGNRFVRKFCTLTIAPGGVGKSTLTMQEAIAVATGKPITGDAVNETGSVWIFNNEDPMDELHRRIAGICLHFGVPLESVANKVFLNSGRERRLIVAKELKDGVVYTPDVDALMHEIERLGIVLMVIDPFVRVHQVSENSNEAIDAVVEVFGRIADRTGCAFNLVHHTRKASNGTTYTGEADSARGAGALMGAARVAHTLVGMTEKEAERFGMKAEERRWFIRMDDAKANMMPPSDKAVWFKKTGVSLPNHSSQLAQDGDSIGVVERWEPPDATEAMHISVQKATDVLRDIQDAWNAGTPFSKSHVSARWAGRMMMDAHEIPKVAVKPILSAWLENGLIEDREYDHRNGKTGLYVVSYPGKV